MDVSGEVWAGFCVLGDGPTAGSSILGSATSRPAPAGLGGRQCDVPGHGDRVAQPRLFHLVLSVPHGAALGL